MRRASLLIGGVVGALMTMLLGGIAWAAIPDAGGVIHTCYSQSTGTWRPIDYPTVKCKSGETQLDFNQKGVKGDTGLQGIQGIQGPKGDKGDQGIQGIQGLTGDKGEQGIQGIQGLKGDQGIQGIQGLKGDQGIQGIQGPKGDAGGLAGWQSVAATNSLPTGAFSTGTVICPPGKTVVGGGGSLHPITPGFNWYAYFSGPYFDSGMGRWGWEMRYVDFSTAGSTYDVVVRAVCVSE